jgi:tRNA threonylcarbamoyl adenosine modification protein (Sua5/YciO/YrdC/YwlC family)
MASLNAAGYAVSSSMRVVSVDPCRPDAAPVVEAVRVLRRGGLVVFPTETVYGLGCRALDPTAIARVFAVKGRPPHHPLIAHVGAEAAARELAAEWPAEASILARAFWPGPLTVVVARASHVPAVLAGGGPSIALRAPVHPVARALIEALADPRASCHQAARRGGRPGARQRGVRRRNRIDRRRRPRRLPPGPSSGSRSDGRSS